RLSAIIHRFAVDDIHESLDNFFTPQLDENQFSKMISLVNNYLSQSVAERYGEFSGLKEILDFQNEIEISSELSKFFAEHNFSDAQKSAISENFAEDDSIIRLNVIDETFLPGEINYFYDIVHNHLEATDITIFLENRRKMAVEREKTSELTPKEKAFLNSDITPFMTKSLLSWDEIESIGFRFFEEGYNDKFAPYINASFGNGLSKNQISVLARRMQNGEDIRKDLTLGLLGGQEAFTTNHGNEFTAEYGENSITARYGNAERNISYEDLGDVFLSLIKSEHDDIVHERTVDDLQDNIPDITIETAENLISAFDNAVTSDWKGDNVKERQIKSALYDILGDKEKTEKVFVSIADMKYNFKVETEKESPISLGIVETPDISENKDDISDLHEERTSIDSEIIERDDFSDIDTENIDISSEAEFTQQAVYAENPISPDNDVTSDGKGDKVEERQIDSTLHDILGDEEKTENESTIHFGLLGNGITAYDVARMDKERDDYVTVAHISPEGVVKTLDNSISEKDMSVIQQEADSAREKFLADWEKLDTVSQFQRLHDRADIETMLNIGKENLSTEEKIAKYMPFVFFGEGERPQPEITETPDISENKDNISDSHEEHTSVDSEIAKRNDFSDISTEKIDISADSEFIQQVVRDVEKLQNSDDKDTPVINDITFLGDNSKFDTIKAVINTESFGTTIADGDRLSVVIYDDADIDDVHQLVETAMDNGVYLNVSSSNFLESRFGDDFLEIYRSDETPDIAVTNDSEEITDDSKESDIDRPLFTDADVIEEIEKSENSTDNRPYWETPDISGEQLWMFDDSIPISKNRQSEP
ncbi:MAG: hypothetical protein K2J39_01400, partial [Ruminococcus sp.]|nr:hypothetical protein [Ruminococcus sp.]